MIPSRDEQEDRIERCWAAGVVTLIDAVVEMTEGDLRLFVLGESRGIPMAAADYIERLTLKPDISMEYFIWQHSIYRNAFDFIEQIRCCWLNPFSWDDIYGDHRFSANLSKDKILKLSHESIKPASLTGRNAFRGVSSTFGGKREK